MRLKAVAAAGLLSVAIVAWSPSAASAAGCSTWGAQPPNKGPDSNRLVSVDVLSTCNAWAVGDYYDASGPNYLSLIEHWNGKQWKIQASPNPGSFQDTFSDVAALSAHNVWAVGSSYGPSGFHALIEHWNGKAWRVQKGASVTGSPTLGAVAGTSPTNVWAVGYRSVKGQDRTLIEHWDGRSWKVQPSPDVGHLENDLSGVAATSADNAWAVGHHVFPGGEDRTLILHWNGTAWKVQRSPNPGGVDDFITAVTATSSTDAWAVGGQKRNGLTKTLTLHWNGTAWRAEHSPNVGTGQNILYGVAATSVRNAWAVGYHITGSGDRTLVLHWNGRAWKVQPSPNPSAVNDDFSDVDASSSTNAWAVGRFDDSPSRAFAVHCC